MGNQVSEPREFDSGSLEFMIWLTRREWQLCYVLSFAAQAEDMIPGMHFTLGDLFRWAILYLQEECGYRFEGLRLRQDGKLVALQAEPVERRNVNFIQACKLSEHPGYAPPSYELHFPVAIEYAKEHVPGRDKILPLLESAHRELLDMVREVRESKPDEETRRAIRAGLEAARETLLGQQQKGVVN